MRRLLNLIPVFVIFVFISACAPQLDQTTQPETAVPATVVVEEPAATVTPESVNTLPAEAVTAEPTIFDNAGETILTWTGTIESLPAGSQFNDQFISDTLEQDICGLDGNSDSLNQLIAQYRDSGKLIAIQGVLFADVPDVNGCQIRVTALEEE